MLLLDGPRRENRLSAQGVGFETLCEGLREAYRIAGFLMSGKNSATRPKRGSPRLMIMAPVTPSRQIGHRRAIGKQARGLWAATAIHAMVKSHLKSRVCMGVPRAASIGTSKAGESCPKVAVGRVLQREGHSVLQSPTNELKAEAVQLICLRDLCMGRATWRQAWQLQGWRLERRGRGSGTPLAFEARGMGRSTSAAGCATRRGNVQSCWQAGF